MDNIFLTNYSEQTFLDRIKENLRKCDSFMFSVSFIKKAGLVLLIKEIDSALQRGAKGKIITSTYQNFTDIDSLRSFLCLWKSMMGLSVIWIMKVFMMMLIRPLAIIQKVIILNFQIVRKL